MGTRADFYIGRGENAEWIGSVAWDGYPEGMPTEIKNAKTLEEFQYAMSTKIKTRKDFTDPTQGWPWPWDDSHTTDYSYAFDEGEVWGSCFGHAWFKASEVEPEEHGDAKPTIFPNMKERAKITFGDRSGLMILKG